MVHDEQLTKISLRSDENWVLYQPPAHSAGLVEGHTNTVHCKAHKKGYIAGTSKKNNRLLLKIWIYLMLETLYRVNVKDILGAKFTCENEILKY